MIIGEEGELLIPFLIVEAAIKQCNKPSKVRDLGNSEAILEDDFSGIKEYGDDKERERLRNNIVLIVKQSIAINRSMGTANMKPRGLFDAIHEEDG
nr:hypothetical protein [Tanacetum cinerariifolium]